MPAADLRLFIAAALPQPVRAALQDCRRALEPQLSTGSVRWTRAEGIHLTLKFLGEVAPQRVGELAAALGPVAAATGPLCLRLGEVGTFGGRGIRVLWVGVQGETAALASLGARVDAALEPLGFPSEKRPYAAHLTLARVKDCVSAPDRRALHAACAAPPVPEPVPMKIDALHLYQSHLNQDGARYQVLESFPLAAF